jgi:hypothetical protein
METFRGGRLDLEFVRSKEGGEGEKQEKVNVGWQHQRGKWRDSGREWFDNIFGLGPGSTIMCTKWASTNAAMS